MKTNADAAFQVMPRKGITLKGKAPIKKLMKTKQLLIKLLSLFHFFECSMFFKSKLPRSQHAQKIPIIEFFAKTFSKLFL